MKIHVLSDIHIEYLTSREINEILFKINRGADVLVLAGDIGSPWLSSYTVFLDHMTQKFPKIFLVCGNHEYYSDKKTVQETHTEIQRICDTYKNITFLQDKCEEYEGVLWIGTTLWSEVTPNTLVDTRDIAHIPEMSRCYYNELHKESIRFLQKALSDCNQASIVITHHIPSFMLVNKKYRVLPYILYQEWFASEQDILIKQYTEFIKLWIYGHSHAPYDGILYDIPFVCNPIGYKKENIEPSFNKIVQVMVD